MITPTFNPPKRFPTDWAQLYALGYGECTALLESFLEDLISRDELNELYQRMTKMHFDRVNNLVMEQSRKLQANEPLE